VEKSGALQLCWSLHYLASQKTAVFSLVEFDVLVELLEENLASQGCEIWKRRDSQKGLQDPREPRSTDIGVKELCKGLTTRLLIKRQVSTSPFVSITLHFIHRGKNAKVMFT
jgi:hypothetical protein